MNAASPDSVVFEKGTREVRCKNGIVTVIAPRDITLGEIHNGLERMVRNAAEKSATARCASGQADSHAPGKGNAPLVGWSPQGRA